MRLILHEKTHLIAEKLSDIDYFVYREKGGFFPKTYIRLWIGTKKTDLIGERDNMKQIHNELRKYLHRKLKKGGNIVLSPHDPDMFPMRKLEAFCKKKSVELKQVLHSGGGFVLLVPEDFFDWASEDLVRTIEDEWNWNLECLPNGKFKITIIPELKKEVHKTDRSELAGYSQLIVDKSKQIWLRPSSAALLEALYVEAKIIDILVDRQIV